LVDAAGWVLVAAAGWVSIAAAGWVSIAAAGWASIAAGGWRGAAGYWSFQAADALLALPTKGSNPKNAVNDIGDLYSERWSGR